MNNRIVSNRKPDEDSVYGRVYLKGTQPRYPASNNYDKFRNQLSYGRRRREYGSKGQYSVK